MANSKYKSYPIFSSQCISYLASLLAVAIVLTLVLPSFLGTSPSLRIIDKKDDAKIPVNITTAVDSIGTRPREPFTDLKLAYDHWDSEVGCSRFRDKFRRWKVNKTAVQQTDSGDCSKLKLDHVSVHVKMVMWIPDYLDGLYECRCGLSCLWTRNEALADRADVGLYQFYSPPETRNTGEPLRAFVELEAWRAPTGHEDIFISYHSSSDVQATYAGKTFRTTRSYNVANMKRDDVLVYWSSSRCLDSRDATAKSFLSHVPHHSFGRCLNNVGGNDTALEMYPDCQMRDNPVPQWWDHLHCAMSHYKFVLAIENTWTESYVSEKLFYPLEAGAVPIYFGAPNVWDLVPPNSIIDASKFESIEKLAEYVKAVAEDPVAYAEFHAWRRCGVLGNYGKVRLASLDTLPCRLCEFASMKGGRNATSTR
ncbi:alpha-(1,4)-fucosyltransferase [Carex littledalei]|uniref:Fucosyltransferase n=1 Tax=Carex littledalei TaxID=544730 RepID=A0A833REH4_9POAL|nr:alpha-(1,4)-fucosyltransferase [Carex littledalei]